MTIQYRPEGYNYYGILALDLEIARAIVMEGDEVGGDIETCGGWDDFDNMGISSAVLKATNDTAPVVLMDDNYEGNIEAMIEAHDAVLTFNGVKFDAPCLKANWNAQIPSDGHIDLLRLVWEAAGHDPDVFNKDTHLGYGLDACCKANDIGGKTGHGAHAPIMFQTKQYGGLISYNIQDVWLTLKLLNVILESGGQMKDPTDPERVLYVNLVVDPDDMRVYAGEFAEPIIKKHTDRAMVENGDRTIQEAARIKH